MFPIMFLMFPPYHDLFSFEQNKEHVGPLKKENSVQRKKHGRCIHKKYWLPVNRAGLAQPLLKAPFFVPFEAEMLIKVFKFEYFL